ncbi:hypothetical protein J6590_050962 [Homalodisca vitripennis]|nr:hypothetical protein J6590_050962 [Homalodisca vitripennis]
MVRLLFTVCLVSLSKSISGVHIFELDYRVTLEPTLTSPDYDGYVFIYSILLTEYILLFRLDYRVTPEPTLTSPDYDGYVFIYRYPPNDSTIPAPIREKLMREEYTEDRDITQKLNVSDGEQNPEVPCVV